MESRVLLTAEHLVIHGPCMSLPFPELRLFSQDQVGRADDFQFTPSTNRSLFFGLVLSLVVMLISYISNKNQFQGKNLLIQLLRLIDQGDNN